MTQDENSSVMRKFGAKCRESVENVFIEHLREGYKGKEVDMMDAMRYVLLSPTLPARQADAERAKQRASYDYIVQCDVFKGNTAALKAAAKSIAKLPEHQHAHAAALLRGEMIKRGDLVLAHQGSMPRPGESFYHDEKLRAWDAGRDAESLQEMVVRDMKVPMELLKGSPEKNTHDLFREQYECSWPQQLGEPVRKHIVEQMMLRQFHGHMWRRDACGYLQFKAAISAPLSGCRVTNTIFDEMDLPAPITKFAADYAANCDQDVGVKNNCANCGRGSADQAFTRGKILCFSPKQSWGDKAATYCCKEWKAK